MENLYDHRGDRSLRLASPRAAEPGRKGAAVAFAQKKWQLRGRRQRNVEINVW